MRAVVLLLCLLLYTVVVVLCCTQFVVLRCTRLLLYFGVHCCVAKEHGSPGRTPVHSRPGHSRSRCVDKYQGFKQTVSPALFSSMSIATHPHILLTVWACGSAHSLVVRVGHTCCKPLRVTHRCHALSNGASCGYQASQVAVGQHGVKRCCPHLLRSNMNTICIHQSALL